MPNLDTYASLLERLQSHELAVDARLCVHVRNRNVSCKRCAEACTSECITVQGNSLQVNPENCIGCGTCATACPTGALSPRQPDDRQIAHAAAQAMRATGGAVVFACADVVHEAGRALDPDTVVGVPCIGRIDESLICVLAAAGASQVRLVAGDCAACPHASGARMAHAVCDDARTLLASWKRACTVRIARTFPRLCRNEAARTAYDAERREFLLAMKSEAAGAAHDVVDYSIDRFFDTGAHKAPFQHVTQDGTLPHALPPRRRLLLDALADMGAPEDEMVATRLWGHVVIDADACKECRMCAVFCPTGALSKRLVRGRDTGLVHAPGLCVKCRSCEEICPAHALHLSEEVFAVDLNAGVVESRRMGDATREKGGPDAIRLSMKKLIDTPYLWG